MVHNSLQTLQKVIIVGKLFWGYGILFASPITLVPIPCLLAAMNDIHSLSGRSKKNETGQMAW